MKVKTFQRGPSFNVIWCRHQSARLPGSKSEEAGVFIQSGLFYFHGLNTPAISPITITLPSQSRRWSGWPPIRVHNLFS